MASVGTRSSASEAPCEGLLLVPLDACAGRSLERRLAEGDVHHSTTNGCVVVAADGRSYASLAEVLQGLLPRALQRGVRGVFAAAPATEQDLAAAMLLSEPLTDVLDRADVEWARTALRDGWLTSVFQPIVHASSGTVFAYEALMRATNPHTRVTVGANQLLFASGRLNLQHELDMQARAAAIREGMTALNTDVLMFVNFLHEAIYDAETCLGTTFEEARKRGLAMSRLVFEVNEIDPRDVHGHLGALLEYLRAQGVAIALDNIGGGWSPLELIADLRPDYVKLDRELVSDAPVLSSARQTLDAVVGLARRLQMRVVAQGIETPEQVRVCAEAGVDYLQGYLIGRPANPPELAPAVSMAPA